MADIVLKLRTIYTKDYPDGMLGQSPKELMTEAADEIERLRKELAEWEAAAQGFVVSSK